MTVKGAKYAITGSRMVDAGDDFDWATYKVARPCVTAKIVREER
jgi:hypothetical protein